VLITGPCGGGHGHKFSKDLVPLTDLKANPRCVVKHATDAPWSVLLTCRGRGVAVVHSDYEKAEEERIFKRAVVPGLVGLEVGHEVFLEGARVQLRTIELVYR